MAQDKEALKQQLARVEDKLATSAVAVAAAVGCGSGSCLADQDSNQSSHAGVKGWWWGGGAELQMQTFRDVQSQRARSLYSVPILFFPVRPRVLSLPRGH